jgi:hypothetical protein
MPSCELGQDTAQQVQFPTALPIDSSFLSESSLGVTNRNVVTEGAFIAE